MHEILSWFVIHYIEVFATITGIIGVYLTARQNIWCWPIGLINVGLSIYVYFDSKLYADMVLQFFYLEMTVYGWYFWVFGGKKKYELEVRNITKTEIIVFSILIVILSFISGFLFRNFTNAAFPYWDSLLLVGGIIATYAMAKKIIQHWMMWIILDINAAILYFIKDLYSFTALYFLFTILAIIGHFQWKKDMHKIKNP